MNFPEAQKIGLLGEFDVARLFTTWSWTVGKDMIDVGYDYVVEPDVDEFRGNRFLVQAKATKIHAKSTGIKAPVEKQRLRQYAKNPHPVFIVRITPEGELYWVHAQAWAKQFPSYLVGSGKAYIKFPCNQLLNLKDEFVRYLREAFQPNAESDIALSELAHKRGSFLSSIDPRFQVLVGVQDGKEKYEIFAKSEPVKVEMEINVKDSERSNKLLQDAIGFGLPTEIDVNSVEVTGSDLFKKIGIDRTSSGVMKFDPLRVDKGSVIISSGNTFEITESPITFPVSVYKGMSGIALERIDVDAVFKLRLQAEFKGSASATFGLNEHLLHGKPIRIITELGQVGDWAEQVIKKRSMRLEVTLKGRQLLWTQSLDKSDKRNFLLFLYWLGRLHKVARALNSDLTVDPDFAFTDEDVGTINFAYWLLKGERREVPLNTIKFIGEKDLPVTEASKLLFMRSEMEITVGGKALGVIPIEAKLEGYTVEELDARYSYRLSKGNVGKALMYYLHPNLSGTIAAQSGVSRNALVV